MIQIDKIVKATANDLDFVYNCIAELENEKFDPEVFKFLFNESILNPNNACFISLLNNEKVGFANIHAQVLLHHCGVVVEIQEFYIIPTHRNKGIAKQLMSEIMQFAKDKKAVSLEVCTNKNRLENTEIYTKLGFNLSHNKFTLNFINKGKSPCCTY